MKISTNTLSISSSVLATSETMASAKIGSKGQRVLASSELTVEGGPAELPFLRVQGLDGFLQVHSGKSQVMKREIC